MDKKSEYDKTVEASQLRFQGDDGALGLEGFLPELVIGFVKPLGSDLPALIRATDEALHGIGYQHRQHVKVTDYFPRLLKDRAFASRDSMNLKEWYDTNMNAGDDLRQTTGEKCAAVLGALLGIAEHRVELTGEPSGLRPAKDTAYLIDSLKTPEEVFLLRAIYGPCFRLIASHCPRNVRIDNLAKESEGREAPGADARGTADKLVERDEEGEAARPYGQNVRDTFALADLFVRTDSSTDVAEAQSMTAALDRYFDLEFRREPHTPTRSEHAMFMAHAASLRSSVASHQVGASICSEDGQVLAIGTNEAPKRGGGAYWEGMKRDGRSFTKPNDPARQMRDRILKTVFERLEQAKLLRTEEPHNIDQLVEQFREWQREQEDIGIRARTLLDDAIEYNREVHAELLAITDAARRGAAIQDQELFTTTFPCHDCAKHIVAGGIKRVVYLEPYAKSLVREFYGDSIHIEGDLGSSKHRVSFENFVGVAPKRYGSLFLASRQKRNGVSGKREQKYLRLSDYDDLYVAQPPSAFTFIGILGEVLEYQRLKSKLTTVPMGIPLSVKPGLRHDGGELTPNDLAGLGWLSYEVPFAGEEGEDAPSPSVKGGRVGVAERAQAGRSAASLARIDAGITASRAADIFWASKYVDDGPTRDEFEWLVGEASGAAGHRAAIINPEWVRRKLMEKR